MSGFTAINQWPNDQRVNHPPTPDTFPKVAGERTAKSANPTNARSAQRSNDSERAIPSKPGKRPTHTYFDDAGNVDFSRDRNPLAHLSKTEVYVMHQPEVEGGQKRKPTKSHKQQPLREVKPIPSIEKDTPRSTNQRDRHNHTVMCRSRCSASPPSSIFSPLPERQEQYSEFAPSRTQTTELSGGSTPPTPPPSSSLPTTSRQSSNKGPSQPYHDDENRQRLAPLIPSSELRARGREYVAAIKREQSTVSDAIIDKGESSTRNASSTQLDPDEVLEIPDAEFLQAKRKRHERELKDTLRKIRQAKAKDKSKVETINGRRDVEQSSTTGSKKRKGEESELTETKGAKKKKKSSSESPKHPTNGTAQSKPLRGRIQKSSTVKSPVEATAQNASRNPLKKRSAEQRNHKRHIWGSPSKRFKPSISTNGLGKAPLDSTHSSLVENGAPRASDFRNKNSTAEEWRRGLTRREIDVSKFSASRCTCIRLPTCFRDCQTPVDLQSLEASRPDFLYHVDQMSNCSAHAPAVLKCCRKSLEAELQSTVDFAQNFLSSEQTPHNRVREKAGDTSGNKLRDMSSIAPSIFYGTRDQGQQEGALKPADQLFSEANETPGSLEQSPPNESSNKKRSPGHETSLLGSTARFDQRAPRQDGLRGHVNEDIELADAPDSGKSPEPVSSPLWDISVNVQRKRHQSMPAKFVDNKQEGRSTGIGDLALRLRASSPPKSSIFYQMNEGDIAKIGQMLQETNKNNLENVATLIKEWNENGMNKLVEKLKELITTDASPNAPNPNVANDIAQPLPDNIVGNERPAVHDEPQGQANEAQPERKKAKSAAQRKLIEAELSRDVRPEDRKSDGDLVSLLLGENIPYERHRAASYAFNYRGRLYAEYNRLLDLHDQNGVLVLNALHLAGALSRIRP